MAFNNYNNNDKQPVTSTFSPISFSNPEGKAGQSRFSISYFNKVMKISIALRTNGNGNNNYATYDNDNAVSVYLSNTKAKILSEMIDMLKAKDEIHNVCVESKNGMIKVSDGTEYGVNSYCISITYASEDGSVHEVVYETKNNTHAGAFNYSDGSFESRMFKDLEIDTFKMTLEEYWRASSYAVAASVMDASLYKREATTSIIKSIAEKVGATSNNAAKHNSKSFLSNNNQAANNAGNSTIPKEYEESSFDDIVNGMK